jgi:quinol monooxygenase YgiN
MRDIMRTLVDESRKEAGCVAYALYQRPDAPNVFHTVEQWVDQAAVDAHMATPHVGDCGGRTDVHRAAGDPRLRPVDVAAR